MTQVCPRDLFFMQQALRVARTGLGRVWPNPSVGCLIVHEDRVVGEGCTAPGGRPHAEVNALRQAGTASTRGATAYISLEPCSHWAVTPPCVDALGAAGIAKVFIAVEDPDPRVDGAGIAALQAAGVEVHVGLCAEEARALNAGFFMRIRQGRPLIASYGTRDGVPYDATLRSVEWPGTPPEEDSVPVALWASGEPSHAWVDASKGARWLLTPPGRGQAWLDAVGQQSAQVIEVGPDLVQAALTQAMQRLGSEGLTRLCVFRDDPLVGALAAAQLLDQDPAVALGLFR